ncbi:putative alkaline lipase [Aspergillus thermomutatus]|uniref:feruloyl esterase n=1 Tax=Aspergillus thermomutatus TaxID=41047 RepID=A0A397HB96_ASPTH|nr:uncharacterized protein CDV56_108370 [Aspergillus thermomutatus]RHZ60371.1 hypothetical protein CDV56_108370 [Aspergillus thermomutatus]
MLSKVSVIVAGLSLASFVCAAPSLESRATSDPSAFADLQRAAELSSAAYTGCLGSAFDVTITKQIYDLATDTQGYIGYSTKKKTIAVVMRGSTTATDILNDIDTSQVTPTLAGVSFPSGVTVMNGVYRPWAAVHDEVIAAVQGLIAQYPDYTLESTGHSLGGARRNQAFADFGTAQNGTLVRGNNMNDGVPNMYVTAPYSFVHYGIEYYSYGTSATTLKCSGERDLQCSAGNGVVGVTPGHFSSFGIALGYAGCGP